LRIGLDMYSWMKCHEWKVDSRSATPFDSPMRTYTLWRRSPPPPPYAFTKPPPPPGVRTLWILPNDVGLREVLTGAVRSSLHLQRRVRRQYDSFLRRLCDGGRQLPTRKGYRVPGSQTGEPHTRYDRICKAGESGSPYTMHALYELWNCLTLLPQAKTAPSER